MLSRMRLRRGLLPLFLHREREIDASENSFIRPCVTELLAVKNIPAAGSPQPRTRPDHWSDRRRRLGSRDRRRRRLVIAQRFHHREPRLAMGRGWDRRIAILRADRKRERKSYYRPAAWRSDAFDSD